MVVQILHNGAQRDRRGLLERVAVDAGADRWEGDRLEAVPRGELQAVAIGVCQQLRVARTAVVHRPNSMDDVVGLEAVALGDARLAGRAAAQRAALGQQLGPGRILDRATYAAAAP